MAPPDSALGTWLGPVSAFRAVPSGNLLWLSLSVLGSYAVGDALFFRSTHALGVPGALAGWLLRS